MPKSQDDPILDPFFDPPFVEPDPFPPDTNAKWQYWTEFDTAEQGVPEEWVWERLRFRRNVELAYSDNMVVQDYSGDIDAWLDYRQKLRDLPSTVTDPTQAEWPVRPQSTTRNVNRTAIEEAAKAAMQANRDFIASTPTAAESVAQVKALSRQINALIRLQLRDISGTD